MTDLCGFKARTKFGRQGHHTRNSPIDWNCVCLYDLFVDVIIVYFTESETSCQILKLGSLQLVAKLAIDCTAHCLCSQSLARLATACTAGCLRSLQLLASGLLEV